MAVPSHLPPTRTRDDTSGDPTPAIHFASQTKCELKEWRLDESSDRLCSFCTGERPRGRCTHSAPFMSRRFHLFAADEAECLEGLSGVVGVAPVAREHWYKLMTAGAMSEDPSILPSSRGLLKRSANASSYLRASERRAASVNTVAFQIANAPSNSCSWRPPHFLSMYAPQPASKRPLQKRVWLHASAAAAGDRLREE